MKIDKNEQNSSTFWISYADLMAGLLFVFMLLIGTIVVKYVLSQNTLASKDQTIATMLARLSEAQGKSADLEILANSLKNELAKIDSENLNLRKSNEIFIIEIDELKKTMQNLLAQNSEANATIGDLNASVLNLNQKIVVLNENLANSEKNASEQMANNEQNLAKIAVLLEQISQSEAKHNALLRDLNITQNRIKNLTGIRVKVISALKEKLSSSIAIDPNSGALRLSSSVLFDKDKAEIKKEAKAKLKSTLQKYFDVLLNDPEISQNIDQIMIEGFTDSQGSYLYNLALSQKRAYAVMDFINSFSTDKRLRQRLIASGRSYNELIMKNGKEDQDASRRIEIKFSLSNKEAINEMDKFLQLK